MLTLPTYTPGGVVQAPYSSSGTLPSINDQLNAQRQAQAQQQAQMQQQETGFLPAVAGYQTGQYFSSPAVAVPTGPTAGTIAPVATEIGATSAPSAALPAAAPAAPTGAFSLSGIGAQGNVFLPAAGAALGYDLIANRGGDRSAGGIARGVGQGAASGAMIGSGFGGAPGALIGAPIGAAIGLGNSLIKTGRTNEATLDRDAIRADLRANGMIGQDWTIETAKGNKFYIGTEGGGRGEYHVDQNNAMGQQSAGWANPIAYVLTGGDKKLAADLTGMISNAALSDAETLDGVRANVLAFIAKNPNINEDWLRKGVAQLLADGKISQQEHDAFQYGIGTLFKGDESLYMTGSVQDFMGNQGITRPTPGAMPSAPTQTTGELRQ